MLGSDRVYLALGLVTTLALGCGGGVDTTGTGGNGGSGGATTSASTSSTSTSSSSSSASSSSGAPVCMGEGPVLAVTKLLLGEGVNGQWKKFGYNIDGLVSSGASTDVCQTTPGGKAGVAYPDGDNGIDNSFGKNLLPQILSLYPTWTNDINAAIQDGSTTVMFKLECLLPTGDAPVMTTKLYGGTPLGKPPKFDGTDKWPVAPELLSDATDPESSTIVFSNSSVLGSTYDAGPNATFVLTVPVSTATETRSIKLTLYAAHLTMTLSDDRKSATAGMIGGVLNTEELVTEVKKIGDLLGICSSPLFAALVSQIRQASDIMSDGTQDPSKTCDGISMGLGFEMKEAQLGVVGPKTPVGTTCP